MPRKHTPRAEQCRNALWLLVDVDKYISAARTALRQNKDANGMVHLYMASEQLAQARAALAK